MNRGAAKAALAAWSDRLGLTRALASLPQRRRLIVLTYHRIGDAAHAIYDPEMYSATPEDFDAQVAFLKQRIGVISLDEALAWLDRPSLRSGSAVLITFDDGYADNYRLAYPALRNHGVSATFFLTTSFVGESRLPWWDRIADYVRRTREPRLHLEYPTALDFDLEREPRPIVLRRLLQIYKSAAMTDPERFIDEIAQACRIEPTIPERIFLDWKEAAEMVAGGMSIGSHTHSHELLAKLTLEEQLHELTKSRQILEAALPIAADVLAYPVGSRHAFSPTTIEAAERSGYRAAFSYYGGINRPGHTARFDIRRTTVDSDVSLPLFRLSQTLSALAGHEVL